MHSTLVNNLKFRFRTRKLGRGNALNAELNTTDMASDREPPTTFEKLSWAFGIVGGIAGLITLITVIIAIGPLMLQRKTISEAKKKSVVGKWRSVVASQDGFGIRVLAVAPRISLRGLVEQEYTLAPVMAIEPTPRIACGWGNFLETSGILPGDVLTGAKANSTAASFAISTERAIELIEGKIPMRWRGSEFVSFCALLGFRQEGRDEFRRSHLPLPALWFGPPGRIAIRESPHGVVASFTPKVPLSHLLPDVVADSNEVVKFSLTFRGYYSAKSLPLGDDRALFLGGKDPWDGGSDLNNPTVQLVVLENEIYSNIEAYLLDIWGLSCDSITFIGQRLIPGDHIPPGSFEIAGFVGSLEVLAFLKQATTRLHPDGYLWTSSPELTWKLVEIYKHAWKAGLRLKDFYELAATTWPEKVTAHIWTHDASRILPALQAITHVHNTFDDVRRLRVANCTSRDSTIAILDGVMRRICSQGGGESKVAELTWSMICCPKLVEALTDSIQNAPGLPESHVRDIFKAEGEIRDGRISFVPLLGGHRFTIPAAGNQVTLFDGGQIIAALASLVLTGLWFTLGFDNNVCYEALCVPNVVDS